MHPVVITTSGELDDAKVQAVLAEVARAPDDAEVIIDLSAVTVPEPHSLRQLAVGLAARPGPVHLRGAPGR